MATYINKCGKDILHLEELHAFCDSHGIDIRIRFQKDDSLKNLFYGIVNVRFEKEGFDTFVWAFQNYEAYLNCSKETSDEIVRKLTEWFKLYENMDVASLYPKTVLAPCPIEKLRNFCSDNNISFKVGNSYGHCCVEFSKFGVPFTVTFDSYTAYIGMNSDTADTIIKKLTAIYKDPCFKVWANSFYGMSAERPTAYYKNAAFEYRKEDIMATKEMTQFYADFNKSVKDNVDFNRIRNTKLGIKKVIFNNPATVVLWKDGTKTVVKCQDGDAFDKEKGLAMAICKKALGTNESHGNFNDIFKKWITED